MTGHKESVCNYCANYNPKNDDNLVSEKNCLKSHFRLDKNEGIMVCDNFLFLVAANIPFCIVKGLLRKNINFENNMSEAMQLFFNIFFHYQFFKIVFDIEHGLVEFIFLNGSEHSYGFFSLESFNIKKNQIIFKADGFRDFIFSIVRPDALLFVEFFGFEHNVPILCSLNMTNRFFNRDKVVLDLELCSEDRWCIE